MASTPMPVSRSGTASPAFYSPYHFRMNRLSRECSTMVENTTLRHFLVACYSEANLTYSRWVKTPVITPGNVYSATYLGLTVASANNQNNGISAKLLNLW